MKSGIPAALFAISCATNGMQITSASCFPDCLQECPLHKHFLGKLSAVTISGAK